MCETCVTVTLLQETYDKNDRAATDEVAHEAFFHYPTTRMDVERSENLEERVGQSC